MAPGRGSAVPYLIRYCRKVKNEPWAVPAWAIVQEARRRAGFSQAQLAALSGTSQSAIARYERARTVPSLTTLYRIARACRLDLRMHLVPFTGDPRQGLIRDALGRSLEDRFRSNDAFSVLANQLRQTGDVEGG